jgi:hypothetical protein
MNHRYTLHRSWLGNRGDVNFIMLNPSTADDTFDDATIRRCVGFAKAWGFSGLKVTNLFAYRATYPKDLKALLATNNGFWMAVGEENAFHISREANTSKMVVCAWGDNCDVHPTRVSDVIRMLLPMHDLFCIRRTKKGNPAHPVRERYTVAPDLFLPRQADSD